MPRSQTGQKPDLKIPSFEPVPPTNIVNRLINKILAPLFYLLFTIVTAVVVIPVWTIVQNLKGKAQGRSSRGGGQKVASDYSSEGAGAETHGGQSGGGGHSKNRIGDYLNAYGGTYGKGKKA